jgi:hypothetical protein
MNDPSLGASLTRRLFVIEGRDRRGRPLAIAPGVSKDAVSIRPRYLIAATCTSPMPTCVGDH